MNATLINFMKLIFKNYKSTNKSNNKFLSKKFSGLKKIKCNSRF